MGRIGTLELIYEYGNLMRSVELNVTPVFLCNQSFMQVLSAVLVNEKIGLWIPFCRLDPSLQTAGVIGVYSGVLLKEVF